MKEEKWGSTAPPQKGTMHEGIMKTYPWKQDPS